MTTVDRQPTVLVLDIDETLLNSVSRHTAELAVLAGKYNWPVYTYEEICKLGGTHSAYGQYQEYWTENRRLRNDQEFNRDLEVIPDAKEAVQLLASQLAFYLTTRPESLAELSREELVKAGFPNREVVARPSDVSIEDTTPWKLRVLSSLARELGQPVKMIDDSVSLHRAILKSGDPFVESILIKGPITNTENTPFEALDWNQIVKQIMQEYQLLHDSE